MSELASARIAIVHDWLTGMRGGERCLEALLAALPGADIFTLFHFPRRLSPALAGARVRASALNRLPGIERGYRALLPLFPAAIRRFDLAPYDLVISISHCVAKGARLRPGQPHLCYCLTPMRYIWDEAETYLSGSALRRAAGALFLPRLRRFDLESNAAVTRWLTTSSAMQERMARLYGVQAEVVAPPVELERFRPAATPPGLGAPYLMVSALNPYKRVDVAIAACEALGRELRIVGWGPEETRLRRLAGPRTRFLGRLTDEAVAAELAGCRALLLPAAEEFGIAPVEAMASGRAVIALGQGGALDTVVGLDDPAGRAPTGVFSTAPTGEALAEAIRRYEAAAARIAPTACRARAETFAAPRFVQAMGRHIEACLSAGRPAPVSGHP